MRYFDHDTTAGSDDKIMALRLEHGGAAVDAYWTLLEKIYHDEKPINLEETNIETKSVYHRLSLRFDELENYVKTMLKVGLFEGDISCFTSERAEVNIEAYQKKCETARQNGKMGGRKPKGKPSRLQDRNQGACKKRKEKKGDITSSVISPTSGGAGAEKPAPPAAGIEVFAEVDEMYERMVEQREEAERMKSEAVPCPPEILAQMGGGA